MWRWLGDKISCSTTENLLLLYIQPVALWDHFILVEHM